MAVESKAADQFSVQKKVAVAGAVLLGCKALLDIVRYWRKRRNGHTFPYAPGYWPIFGHVSAVAKYCKFNGGLAVCQWGIDLHRTLGMTAYAANMAGHEMIIVNDPDIAQQVFEGDPQRMTKDFTEVIGDLLEYSFKDGLFTAASASMAWQLAHRVLISPFSVRSVRALHPFMCEQADEMVKAMKRDVGYGNVTFIDTWVSKMAFETLAVCGLGTSFGCFESAEEHPFVRKLNEVVEAFSIVGKYPKWLRPIFCRKQWYDYIDNARSCRETAMDIIRKRRNEEQKDVRKDLLDRMLLDADPKTGQFMPDDLIIDNLLTLMFAGQDSTAAAMATCLCYLCSYPKCKERLIREIDEVVGDEALTYEHFSQLTYLDWCIKETLRLIPSVPSALRIPTCDQMLGDFFLPKEVAVNINIMGLHYSKEHWGPDVDEFKPERFENGGPAHKFAYQPFAFGPRACIGREFSLLEQKVTMVKFFQNFDIELAPFKEEPGFGCLEADRPYPPFFKFKTMMKKDSAFVGAQAHFKLLPRSSA